MLTEQSVGSRISWGAILAGTILALAFYLLFLILGAAVGLSLSPRIATETLHHGALWWALLTLVASLFVGGLVTSLFTVGETKTESLVYGILVWALMLAVLAGLGGMGLRGGYFALLNQQSDTSDPRWDIQAQNAGVPADQVNAWRRKLQENTGKSPLDPELVAPAAKHAWHAFLGAWLSMAAAAAGAWMGAGSTFRIRQVTVTGLFKT